MKRVELNEQNRQRYALNCGLKNIPRMNQKISKKRIRLNYKQYNHSLREIGDMLLCNMMVGEELSIIDELMDSPLDKYISLATNDFGYGGMADELIVNYVHLLFLKAKSAASREDNPNWREDTSGVFDDNYCKETKVDIANL